MKKMCLMVVFIMVSLMLVGCGDKSQGGMVVTLCIEVDEEENAVMLSELERSVSRFVVVDYNNLQKEDIAVITNSVLTKYGRQKEVEIKLDKEAMKIGIIVGEPESPLARESQIMLPIF